MSSINLPIVQNRPRSSATKRIKMLSFLEASGTRDLMTSLATDSILIAAMRFAVGDPKERTKPFVLNLINNIINHPPHSLLLKGLK